jgi:hypothetical protein
MILGRGMMSLSNRWVTQRGRSLLDGVLQDRISREIPVDYLPDVRREAMRGEVPTIRLPMPPSKCMRSANDYRKA